MQRYLIEQYLDQDNQPWNYQPQLSFNLEIRNLSLPIWFKSLKAIYDRHPLFRTTLLREGDEFTGQVINDNLSITTAFYDIKALSKEAQDNEIDRILTDDLNRPFDLCSGDEPLFRSYVMQRSQSTIQFVLVGFHGVWDGWSLAIFLKEVFAKYHELKANPIAPTENHWYEFGEFVHQNVKAADSPQASKFWKDLLKHAEKTSFPIVANREFSNDYKPLKVLLPNELSKKIILLTPLMKRSVKAILSGVFMQEIARVNGTSNITLALVTNGRNATLTNPLGTLGMLWNLAPLNCELKSDIEKNIENLNRMLLAQAAYNTYPLPKILDDCKKSNFIAGALNYVDFEYANLLPPDSDIKFVEIGGLDKFHFPLHLFVGKNPFDKSISLVLNYDTRMYSEQQIESIMNGMTKTLEHLTDLYTLPKK